jgi:preprotein translocase subunit SecE
MSVEAESKAKSKSTDKGGASWLNAMKWVIVGVLVAAGVMGNAYFAEHAWFYRMLGLVALAIVALGVAVTTTQGKAFLQAVKDARAEIRKVVWLTRQETNRFSIIVVIAVTIMAFILWGLDVLFGFLASLVIG